MSSPSAVLLDVQAPRFRARPERVSSAGPEAVELAASAGLILDPWQEAWLDDALSETAGGRWAAFEAALIVPRQNGKGSVLEALELAGLFLFDEQLILHSAHEFKALDVDTIVLTTGGWVPMGHLQAGAEVFAPDGQPTKVTAAHPIRTGRPCFAVRLDDGQEIVADAEHLWDVTDAYTSTRKVLTTQDLIDGGVSKVEPRAGRDRRTYRYRLDIPAALVAPDADLPLDPWLLGAWLGDGTSAQGALTVGAEDLSYVLERLDALGERCRVRGDRRWPDRVSNLSIAGLKARLRSLGLLGNKHIPESYLLASEDQRRALLAGIMDTDGTVSAHQIAVTMIKRDLMGQVLTLVRSLGYKATLREFRASLKGADAGAMHRVQFSASQDVSPFHLPRKTAKIRARQFRSTRSQYNAIVAIDPVPTRPTRCITVAHESGCYLAGPGLIPTHNTAQEAFRRVLTLIQSTPDLDRLVQRVRTSHGEEGVELRTGQRLRFVARSTGSGRGFSGDRVILDEAYNLSGDAMAALLPTMSARPNPQLIYTSSAPLDRDESEVLRRLCKRGRTQAQAGVPGSMVYAEFCADRDDEDTDEAGWRAANPGCPHRISVEHIAKEREALDPDGFRRERLGIWNDEDDAGEQVLPAEQWAAGLAAEAGIDGTPSFGLDVSQDRAWAAFGAAGRSTVDPGRVLVEVVDSRRGTGWVVDRARALLGRWGGELSIAKGSPAAALIPDLVAAGVPVDEVSGEDVTRACGQLYDAVVGDRIHHRGQPVLEVAVRGAVRQHVGDAWKWSRRRSTVDIAPLVAVTLAGGHHGLEAPQPEEDWDVLVI